MGYLVYCPTCNGKMSNNAKSCPHCGETHLTRKIQKQVLCKNCNGTGVEYEYTRSVEVLATNNNIYIRGEKTGKMEPYDRYDIEDGFVYQDWRYAYADHKDKATIREHIRRGDYSIYEYDNRYSDNASATYAYENNQKVGRCNAILYYHKSAKTCSVCKGKKYTTESGYESICKKV